MKSCSQCQQTLPLDAFDEQKTGRQGRRADCKSCRKRFTRSMPGLVKAAFSFQKQKSHLRGYALPNYSEQELLEWAEAQPQFPVMYRKWVDSNYATNLKPSFDRINDYISYRLDNLQILTWEQNNQKGYASQISGDNNKKNLAVDMLDMEGNFIERFHSVSEAARRFNGIPSNIIGAIIHRTVTRKKADGSARTYNVTTAYGYRWRYSNQPNLNKEQTNANLHRV